MAEGHNREPNVYDLETGFFVAKKKDDKWEGLEGAIYDSPEDASSFKTFSSAANLAFKKWGYVKVATNV